MSEGKGTDGKGTDGKGTERGNAGARRGRRTRRVRRAASVERAARSANSDPSARPGRSRSARPRLRTGRLVAVLTVVLAIVGLLTADRMVGRPDSAPPSVNRSRLVATAPDSGSSTWFCAGGIATTTDAIADLRVVLANPSDEPARGTVTFMGERGQRTSVPVVVPAQGRSELTSKDVLPVNDVAALVELNVGGIGVDHRLTRGTQSLVAPCTPTASDVWHFPLGVTTRDATTVISLFNPFAEDALLDFRFASNSGGARPTALQGFVVPAGSVRTVNVGSYVRRRSAVATTISARVGRVVAEQVIRFDGSGGPRGVTLVPGSPAVGRAWYFPAGRSTNVLKERYVLYNPSAVDVQAHVDVVVAGGDIEPFVFDVPARDEVVLDLGDEARVPKNVDYSVVVSTTTRTGVVAGRLVDARSTFRRGIAGTLGSRIASDEWLVADAAASAQVDDRVVVLNPTDTPAPLTLRTLGAEGSTTVRHLGGPSSDELVVPAGGRVDVRLGDVVALDAGALVVATDGTPVVVERVRVAVAEVGPLALREPNLGGAGVSTTLPVAATTTVPAVATTVPATVATAPAPTVPAAATVPAPTVTTATTAPAPSSSGGSPAAAAPVTSSVPPSTARAPAIAPGWRFGMAIEMVATPTTPTTPTTTVAPAPTTTVAPARASVPPSSAAPSSALAALLPTGAVPSAAAPTTAPATTVPVGATTVPGAPASTSPAGVTTTPPGTSVASSTTTPTTTTPTTTTSTTTTTTTTTTALPGTRILVGRTQRAALGTSAAIAIPLR